MKIKWVSPSDLWSNFSELSEENKILLTENQYRKQLSFKHSYIPIEKTNKIENKEY